MKIKKAIFPVGGLGTRFLPATKSMPKEMLPVVDKPLIQYAVEEAAEAGIEQFIFVTSRGKSSIENHFDHSFELEHNLSKNGNENKLKMLKQMIKIPGSFAYIRQQEPAGLGHAIWCARHLIKNEPFAVLLADDLITGNSLMSNMIKKYEGGNMMAIMEIEKKEVSSYGIIEPGQINENIVEIKNMVEKPTIESSPSNLAIVGRYILEPEILKSLHKQDKDNSGEIQLTDSIRRLIGNMPCNGFKFDEQRFDCGSKLGFLKANISFALQRKDLGGYLKNWLKKI